MTASVTQRLAEWIVGARYEDIPTSSVQPLRDRFLDSFGVQFAGMTVSTGQIMAQWVHAQQANPECTVVGTGFRTSCAYAALVNGTSGHALELCDIATFSGHPANPLTAAAMALGEKFGSSGRDIALAWQVAWEVTGQATRICVGTKGNELINRGWFNQGFQPALGIAAMASKIMGFDVRQTRMALGNAASAMGGIMKNRASDTKPFAAGNAAMHGIMAAELVALGFTANEDIFDGEDGVARLLGLEAGDPERLLNGLGSWDFATKGSVIRQIASCAAGHWGVDAFQKITARRPTAPDEIEAIDIYVNDFLIPNKPYHDPKTGMEAKFSIEYDLVAVALHGRAGMKQYSDELVRRDDTQAMMKRVTLHGVTAEEAAGKLIGRVAVKLKNGEVLEQSSTSVRGRPDDPLSREEIDDKFHELSEAIVPLEQRNRIIELCSRLETLENLRTLGEALQVRTKPRADAPSSGTLQPVK